MRRSLRWAFVPLLPLLLGACGDTASVAPQAHATVTRTELSIPTIEASSFFGLGYGTGYAQAEDQICRLADVYVTLSGERARYFGPDSADSDLYYSYINRIAPYDEMISAPPPHGLLPEVLAILDGFVLGYNTYLDHVGIDNLPDERCRGRAWVRPITRMDVVRRVADLSGLGGRDLVRDGMIQAEPPGRAGLQTPAGDTPAGSDRVGTVQEALETLLPGAASVVDAPQLIALARAISDRISAGGSNAVALGRNATVNGSGLLLANPHWTWDGPDRFWQMHQHVPGKIHVAGMGFIGQPMVMIGHNDHVAWSHTVSAARRLAVMKLALEPGQPTRYRVDGEIHTMNEVTVTVDVREADGRTTQRSKTFYESIYGPITTSLMGIDVLPWTRASAYALVDMNAGNGRIANQFLETTRARSARELYAVHAKYVANPWATTTVADDQGVAMFLDVGTVPNISDAFARDCNTLLGRILWNAAGIAVLDGERSDCAVPSDPDSPAAMVMPAARQPVQERRDYVLNANESHWLTNAYAPMEGYSRVFGPERSMRAMRTRMGHRIILDRLEGWDGAPQPLFDRQGLQDALFNNRNKLGELWAEDLAGLCRTLHGDVDVSEACDVLAGWGRTNNLDDPGAVFFQRFSENAGAEMDFMLSFVGLSVSPLWAEPFVLSDPVNTPRGLHPGYQQAVTALETTVTEFRSAGIPLDATLRDYQLSRYGDDPIPLHGGEGGLGMFNALSTSWTGERYDAGGSGPSFVMVTQFGGECPDTRTLLLGSQRSAYSGWPHATEQVEMYSQKRWHRPPFCDGDLERATIESVTQLGPHGVED